MLHHDHPETITLATGNEFDDEFFARAAASIGPLDFVIAPVTCVWHKFGHRDLNIVRGNVRIPEDIGPTFGTPTTNRRMGDHIICNRVQGI